MIRFRPIILCLVVISVLLSACSQGTRQELPETDVVADMEAPTPAVVDTLSAADAAAEEIAEETPSEWSLRDRALAFKPELQALQEHYDDAMHLLTQGDLLGAQEMLDHSYANLGEAQVDSVLNASGLAHLYLGSLQKRLDRLQEILDEESLMHFAAPLEVADDSLVALWYGGLPDSPARPLAIEQNARVQKWIDHFTGRGRKTYQQWLDRGMAYRPLIEEALERHELPPELYYLAMIESGFKTSARSSAGAVGPWQFIRGTARRYGLTVDYWVDERRDPVRSTEAACQYLSHLYGIFQDWNLAMAGYNSGEFRVQSAVRRAGSRDFWKLRLPRQTQDYVPKMMAAAWVGAHLEEYGFTETAHRTYTYENLEVSQAVDLSLIAKKGRFKRSSLEFLNPHLLRWCTPPDRPGYEIHVPRGSTDRLETALASLSKDERVSFARHRVRRGETLYEIAKGYGTSVGSIIRRNNIRNPRLLRAGTTLVIPTHPDRGWQQPTPNGVAAAAAKVLPPLDVPSGKAKGFYTVRKGDNLSVIARRLGIGVKRLQRWNGMGRSTRIYPNQVLQYLYASPGSPGSGSQVADGGTPSRHIHVVKKGESLYSISRHYGTTVASLLGWNKQLSKETLLHPGDRLVLYLGS